MGLDLGGLGRIIMCPNWDTSEIKRGGIHDYGRTMGIQWALLSKLG